MKCNNNNINSNYSIFFFCSKLKSPFEDLDSEIDLTLSGGRIGGDG